MPAAAQGIPGLGDRWSNAHFIEPGVTFAGWKAPHSTSCSKPLRPRKLYETLATAWHRRRTGAQRATPRVLVADDNTANHRVWSTCWKAWGYAPNVAANGRERSISAHAALLLGWESRCRTWMASTPHRDPRRRPAHPQRECHHDAEGLGEDHDRLPECGAGRRPAQARPKMAL